MKMTIVTNGKGKLIASMFEDASKQQVEDDGPSATLKPSPGQAFQEVDVPDDYAELSPDDLHQELRKYVSVETGEGSPGSRP
jgi:hypothetical protein